MYCIPSRGLLALEREGFLHIVTFVMRMILHIVTLRVFHSRWTFFHLRNGSSRWCCLFCKSVDGSYKGAVCLWGDCDKRCIYHGGVDVFNHVVIDNWVKVPQQETKILLKKYRTNNICEEQEEAPFVRQWFKHEECEDSECDSDEDQSKSHNGLQEKKKIWIGRLWFGVSMGIDNKNV